MEHDAAWVGRAPLPGAAAAFGPGLPGAEHFAELVATRGVTCGVIGPGEVDRLWQRHLLNSVAAAELVAPSCRLLDVGSGGGLPGIPLALARPDVDVELLEPMARRVRWLVEVVATLGLPVTVRRGRAEEPGAWDAGTWDVVTARAVAPLGRLAAICLPLVRPGGQLLALKGRSAQAELDRDRRAVRAAGGSEMEVVECGIEIAEQPTTVVRIRRGSSA